MFGNPINRKPVISSENCKIKIKKTTKGKEIQFSGNCSKEQISIAKDNLSDVSDRTEISKEDY